MANFLQWVHPVPLLNTSFSGQSEALVPPQVQTASFTANGTYVFQQLAVALATCCPLFVLRNTFDRWPTLTYCTFLRLTLQPLQPMSQLMAEVIARPNLKTF